MKSLNLRWTWIFAHLRLISNESLSIFRTIKAKKMVVSLEYHNLVNMSFLESRNLDVPPHNYTILSNRHIEDLVVHNSSSLLSNRVNSFNPDRSLSEERLLSQSHIQSQKLIFELRTERVKKKLMTRVWFHFLIKKNC